MITRRDLIKWGMVAPALAAGSQAAFAAAPQGLDALLVDERFPFDDAPLHAGVPVMRFAGDVTRVWYEVLDARWRERGFVLGGITGSDALFVLETLATHQGRRVVTRTPLAEPDARGVAPVSWVIAPHHPSVAA
ncbi:hypothetical protein [Alteraurantiacibacter aquimixticola]|uniref:Twin-arginine translocation signal domain-containing protein n=1 Tax=Alteraurantiacibacter aquimixticola TaxID=2489173 RepID=A0A4T3F3F1_9SPHN|nr:hypothetical protein [Alteraurantiacibacter aquimixticola]TIX50949.1 hypothetical protein E5222_00180 [Alteraurantiacibacter aquimixticola]